MEQKVDQKKEKLITFLTHEQLVKLNNKAIRKHFNRKACASEVAKLDPTKRYPVVFEMIHNDWQVRTLIVINEDGDQIWLDMDAKDWANLDKVLIT